MKIIEMFGHMSPTSDHARPRVRGENPVVKQENPEGEDVSDLLRYEKLYNSQIEQIAKWENRVAEIKGKMDELNEKLNASSDTDDNEEMKREIDRSKLEHYKQQMATYKSNIDYHTKQRDGYSKLLVPLRRDQVILIKDEPRRSDQVILIKDEPRRSDQETLIDDEIEPEINRQVA